MELDRRVFTAKARKIARKLRAAAPGRARTEAADCLLGLIEGIDASDLRLWSFRDVLRQAALNAEDSADIDAMIAYVVNRRLAGGSSNSSKKRHERGK